MSDQKTQEPSMEEILASIRRIISEEGGGPTEGGARSRPGAASAPPQKDEVLELTEVVEDDGSVKTLDREAPEAPAILAPAPEPAAAPAGQAGAEGAGLISEPAAAAAAGSLAELAILVARREVKAGVDIPLGNADRTLESLVAELLRPLLREWLDRNLPGVIERLVRQEIEKLVRRAEGP